MSSKPIIAVVGATGAQGGALVRAILADRSAPFAVRAITRNPDSEKARALAVAGADIVAADLDDPASVRKAFAGAHGAYCVTNYWEHYSPEREVAQGGNMAAAAQDARVAHVIWSTLEDTRRWLPLEDTRMPTLMGKYKVPHFDGKGEADRRFAELGVPTTILLTSFYWENFIHFGMGPRPGVNGALVLSLPMGEKRLPGIAAEDIGRCAYGVFKRGRELIGRTVGVAGGHLTGAQMAASLEKALGQGVRYESVPFAVYRNLGFPGADDLANMFQFKHDFEGYFCGARSLEFARALNPSLQSFDQWLVANKGRIPLESQQARA